jgi:MutS domain V
LMNRASPAEVGERQAAVQELAQLLELRQELEALALAVVDPLGPSDLRPKKKSRVNTEPLIAWAESQPLLSHKRSLVWVARLSPPLTIAWLFYCLAQDWHPITWLTPLILQAILLLSIRDITARVFAAVSSSQGVFLRFGPMLHLLESMQPTSALLAGLKQATESETREPPSFAMRSFERVVSWFELRHNGLVHPLINGLLLWDVHCVIQLEAWQARSGKHLRAWFQALGELEALSSLATFAYDNPDYAFPELSEGPARFEAQQLGHPLLPLRSRVNNDVSLAGPGQGLLVTGSNMSGKSTLLRAMGINAVLAQTGAPVCAKHLKLSPLAVRSSMRISDSLDEGVSHFYAEIKKLGSVLQALGGDVPVFFLLDEVLHGTNSRERQIGARWVLKELIEHGAIGAVSTHDSGLCELPEPLMPRVQQVHLRETVVGDEMTFDYLVRPGPVRSGNALRLMRSLGIGVPLEE